MAVKKVTKKAGPKATAWASQAALETLLKFSPQESALQDLYTTAQQTYDQKAAAAQAFTRLQQQAIKDAAHTVDNAYKYSEGRQSQIDQQANATLSQIGAGSPGAQAAQAAVAGGVGLGATQQNQARAGAAQAYGDQGVAAVQAGQYQVRGAQADYTNDITKILQQKQALKQQEGANSQLTYQQLHDAAAKLAASRGNAYISAGMTPDGKGISQIAQAKLDADAAKAKAAKHGKVSASGTPLQTPVAHQAAVKQISSGAGILHAAQVNKHPGVSDAELVSQLEAGSPAIPAAPIYKKVKGKQVRAIDQTTGAALSTDAVAATPPLDPVLAKASVEMVRHGRISADTQKKLALAGYSIKQLGLVTNAQFKANKKKQAGSAIGNIASGAIPHFGN